MINRLGLTRRAAGWPHLLICVLLAWQTPCSAGSPMFEAGQEAYLNGDIATALTMWRPLAERGDAEAQFAVGTLYYGGIGVPVDRVESSYWFLRAAEQGYLPAQYNLGNAYKRGEGVRQNDKQAVMWWRKAAEQGFAAAQFNLAQAYLDGAGVARNEAEARRLFRQSADNGHYPAVQALERLAGANATPRTASPVATASTATASCADWLSQQHPRSYTLQLMSSTVRADAEEVLAAHPLDPHAICAYNKDGRRRYMLLYGIFADSAAAQQAIAALPEPLRRNQPWIRRIRAVNAQLTAPADTVTPR